MNARGWWVKAAPLPRCAACRGALFPRPHPTGDRAVPAIDAVLDAQGGHDAVRCRRLFVSGAALRFAPMTGPLNRVGRGPDAMAASWEPLYITVGRDLLLRFFVTFARFEFALKNSRFFAPQGAPAGERPEAHADWDAFAKSIRPVFRAGAGGRLRDACDYLLRLCPPWREVVEGQKVMWDSTPPPEDLPEIQRLLLSVRRVRNSLFHGGKFTTLPVGDAGRNATLLQHSLVVLEECLRLSEEVRVVYEDATL